MTRGHISAALAGVLSLASVALTASDVRAFPVPSQIQPGQVQSAVGDLIQVRGGCGLGWHRGPWGGCRPNGAFYAYAPGIYGCWWRATPWGPRRVCAW